MTIDNLLSKETKTVRDRLDLLLKKDLNALVGKCFMATHEDESENPPTEWFMIEQIDDGAIVGTQIDFCDGDFSISTGFELHFGDASPVSKAEFVKTLARAQSMLDQKIEALKEDK